MKMSELLEILEEHMDEYGDKDVWVVDANSNTMHEAKDCGFEAMVGVIDNQVVESSFVFGIFYDTSDKEYVNIQ